MRRFDDFAVGDDFGEGIGAETAGAQQRARRQADEAVAPEAFAADDRFQQEAEFASAFGMGQLQVQRERGFEIGESLGDQRDAVEALQGKTFEFEFGDQG